MQLLYALCDALFPPRESERSVRTMSERSLGARVSATAHEYAPILGLLPYRDSAVQACVREAKFHNNQRAAKLLGAVLADYLQESLADSSAFEEREIVLVPIPLSSERLRERGYNQAERIARYAAVRIPQLVHFQPELLSRTRDTKAQTSLTRKERLKNMRDAFNSGEINPTYRYILIDDVTTTGATLGSALEALRAQGALHTEAIALAY